MELPIPGYSKYLATTDGQIISLRTGRARRTVVSTNGYPSVPLVGDDGVRRFLTVHRLVARTFLPLAGGDRAIVRHLNDDKLDNRAVNLAWGDHRQNARDAISNGTIYAAPIHDRSRWAEFRARYEAGERVHSLAVEHGVHVRTMYRYIKGRR